MDLKNLYLNSIDKQAKEIDLEAIAAEVMKDGPRRVIIDKYGTSLTWRQALERHNISTDIIFIRADGWTLGCPVDLAKVAKNLWKEAWVGVMIAPLIKVREYYTGIIEELELERLKSNDSSEINFDYKTERKLDV